MANLPFSVCVYCGSRDGSDPAFAAAATGCGAMLARQGWRLVYGAGDVGLMGRVARGAQAGGGETFGVIPQHLMDWEVGKTDLTTFIVTETMHERKKVMMTNVPAVVVLPGGAGSLDELFEALTWRQLGLHDMSFPWDSAMYSCTKTARPVNRSPCTRFFASRKV